MQKEQKDAQYRLYTDLLPQGFKDCAILWDKEDLDYLKGSLILGGI